MEIIIGLIIGLLFGWSCFSLAKATWPNSDEWVHWVAAVLGFLTGLISLVVYAVLYFVLRPKE